MLYSFFVSTGFDFQEPQGTLLKCTKCIPCNSKIGNFKNYKTKLKFDNVKRNLPIE